MGVDNSPTERVATPFSGGRPLVLLYLTPHDLFKNNYLLEQQWTSLETLIPCFLKSLYEGKIDVRLHEFDKLFSGLRNIQTPEQNDVLAKVASLWYYFTRITHQSVGPRVGNFAEELVKHWAEMSGSFEKVEKNATLSTILKEYFGLLGAKYKNRIDFFMKGRERAVFLELRMSEHTGGRTGQESLLDKFNKVLDLVVSDELVMKSIAKGFKEIELCIAILFNENQELIDRSKQNYNVGRVNSLISYVMEENHVWGRVSKLVNRFYLCDGLDLNRINFEKALKNKHEVCLKHRKENFIIRLRILLGDDFFQKVLGASLHGLIAKHGEVIADDLWVLYTLTLNELKIANMFDKTHPRRIYEASKEIRDIQEVFNDFRALYQGSRGCSLTSYLRSLNDVINKLAYTVLTAFSRLGYPLRLLESNDLAMAYNYLRYVSAASLALYLTINMKKDPQFSTCRWD